jgi:integrase/recombinase XerD
MSPLREALSDYLQVRRALGYKLKLHGAYLPQFVAYLEDIGAQTLTTEHALRWATLPAGVDVVWWRARLGMVRGFAAYLQTIDPATEVPPTGLLPARIRRETPYLYSEAEITALITVAGGLRSPLLVVTYQTLIGLLAATGMRIGEALALDREDIDFEHGTLVVKGKFGKVRELPLHPSTVKALRAFLRQRDRLHPSPSAPAVFISTAGTRLVYADVNQKFTELKRRAGLKPRSARCQPRLHSLRHTFAVRTVLEGYEADGDVQGRLALLSTYMGHVDPRNTYWYLSAAPELLALAAKRLERHLIGEHS